jgi:signal transduction histidine kinase
MPGHPPTSESLAYLRALPPEKLVAEVERLILRECDIDTVDAWIAAAKEIASEQREPEVRYDVMRVIAYGYVYLKRFTEAQELMHETAAVAAAEGVPKARHDACNILGMISCEQGNPEEGIRHFERGLAGMNEDLFPEIAARLHHNFAVALNWNGSHDLAITHLLRASEVRRITGNMRGMALDLVTIADLEHERGMFNAAHEALQQSLELFRVHGHSTDLATTHIGLAAVLAAIGKAAEALEHLENGLRLAEAITAPRFRSFLYLTVPLVYERLGMDAEWQGAIERALDALNEGHDDHERARALAMQGTYALRHGRFAVAIQSLQEAAQIAERVSHHSTEATWLSLLGAAQARSGQLVQGIASLQRSIRVADQIGAMATVSQAYERLAEAYRNASMPQQAFDALHSALRIERDFSRKETERRVEQAHRENRTTTPDAGALLRQRKLIRRLELQLDETNEIISITAHDLRSPLSQVRGIVEMILTHYRTLGQQDIQDLLSEVRHSTDRMQGIIRTILDLGRTDSGQSGIRHEVLDACFLLRSAVNRYAHQASVKRISLTMEQPASDFIGITGDAVVIDEILDNLISNAIKFTPIGGAVTCGVRTEEGAAVLTIRDSGPGIPESERDRLFMKYSTLSPRPTAGEPSTGLGLYISHRLAHRMGGSVTYNAKYDHGAAFDLRLPNDQQGKA